MNTYIADLKITTGKKPINVGYRVEAESIEAAESLIMRDVIDAREKVDLCIEALGKAAEDAK